MRFLLVPLFALFACNGPDEESDPLDTETDTDTDSDSDGDTDSDTDTDTDSDTDADVVIDVTTSMGAFAVRLDEENAPITTANFLAYVDAGYYDGDDGNGATVFHRVIANFVAQGGGFTESGTKKTTQSPIVLESDNGLSNVQYTIAMARTSVPDSATSQFYVNLVDNGFLDYKSSAEPGYAVFGEVIEGMSVIDAIGLVDTSNEEPVTAVVITSCERR